MNRIKLIIGFIALSGSSVFAQQQTQYSQYMLNYFLINPAANGMNDQIEANAGYRVQWAGIENAPTSYYLTSHMPFGKLHSSHHAKRSNKVHLGHHSAGLMLNGQSLGPIKHNGFYLNYTYHVPLDANHFLAMGMMMGGVQYTLDAGSVTLPQSQRATDDPAITQNRLLRPDGNIGMWLYSKNYFGGLSMAQMLGNKLAFSVDGSEGGKLNRHYYLTGGYAIKLKTDVKLIPSVLVKYTGNKAYQMDLNAKIKYSTIAWGGLSYRYQDAMVLMMGACIHHSIDIGYSFDLTTSRLRNYTAGTHELMMGVRFGLREDLVSPTNFW